MRIGHRQLLPRTVVISENSLHVKSVFIHKQDKESQREKHNACGFFNWNKGITKKVKVKNTQHDPTEVVFFHVFSKWELNRPSIVCVTLYSSLIKEKENAKISGTSYCE